jgi:hypothetical protein
LLRCTARLSSFVSGPNECLWNFALHQTHPRSLSPSRRSIPTADTTFIASTRIGRSSSIVTRCSKERVASSLVLAVASCIMTSWNWSKPTVSRYSFRAVASLDSANLARQLSPRSLHTTQMCANHSIQGMGASRSGQWQLGRRWGLAPTADARRSTFGKDERSPAVAALDHQTSWSSALVKPECRPRTTHIMSNGRTSVFSGSSQIRFPGTSHGNRREDRRSVIPTA